MALSIADLGGSNQGNSSSTATQSADVSFIPSVGGDPNAGLLSPYPAGQGLATINVALPGSAATAAPASTLDTVLSDPTTLITLAVIGVAIFFLLKR